MCCFEYLNIEPASTFHPKLKAYTNPLHSFTPTTPQSTLSVNSYFRLITSKAKKCRERSTWI